MLPSVINNFLFEKSYVYDLVTLIYPNRRVSNIIPFSFTRKYTGEGNHYLDDKKSFYYGYFLFSKDTPDPQIIIFNSGGVDAVIVDVDNYKFDQFLMLVNILNLQNAAPSVNIHFIGYKIQMEDIDIRPDFYVPPTAETTVNLGVLNNLADQIQVNFLVRGVIVGVVPFGTERIFEIPAVNDLVITFSSPENAPFPEHLKVLQYVRGTTDYRELTFTNWNNPIHLLNTADFTNEGLILMQFPPLKFSVTAYLTDRDGIDNATFVEFNVIQGQIINEVSFKIGRCVTNTSSSILYCYGSPEGGAGGVGGDPNDYHPMTLIPGVLNASANITPSPGASFGYINKIRIFDLVGLTAENFEKVPNQNWELVIE